MKSNDFETILQIRLSRRGALKTLAVGGTLATAGGLPGLGIAGEAGDPSSLRFKSPQRRITADHHVAPGYSAQVLIRWGDAAVAGAPPFNPLNQSADAQERQFGYNNDFVAYLSLPVGSESSDHGLLCVNHEFTDAQLMFPGLTLRNKRKKLTREQADVELAAHGHSIIEVRREAGAWQVVENSRYGRRLTLRSTPMKVSGPAAGHRSLRTNADPAGRRVIGTINNCAGGVTPWGTVLVAEENFHQYFDGDPDQTGEGRNYRRYGIRGKARYPWGKYFPRFDLAKEPNEPNRFGWVVEYDPYDPESVPVKRTALGRFKHEAATCMVNADGRLVVYSGDDQRFEHLYRFVSKGRVDAGNREANRDLLDEGTLF
ncbi:MAG: dTDP-glucose 4,6-dehydratase, partial [Gammaproteobacteria bacterium]